MTPDCRQCTNSVEGVLLNQVENSFRLILNPTVAAPLQEPPPAKTHIYATKCASLWGIKGMVGLSVGGAKRYPIAFAALIALAAVAFFPRGSSLEAARDYEECVEAI